MMEWSRPGQRTVLMSRDLICQWLKVPAEPWPPDHYTLLGVAPAEKELPRIEQHVEQRMQIVRRYQLTHPEPATEGLNLLARAFICLSDPNTRKVYDAALFGTAEPIAEPEPDEAEAPEQLLDAPEAAPAPAVARTILDTAVAEPPRPRPVLPPALRDTPAPGRALDLGPVPLLPAEPAALAPGRTPPPGKEKLDPAVESARDSGCPQGPGHAAGVVRPPGPYAPPGPRLGSRRQVSCLAETPPDPHRCPGVGPVPDRSPRQDAQGSRRS